LLMYNMVNVALKSLTTAINQLTSKLDVIEAICKAN
jgi:hypothetical protein